MRILTLIILVIFTMGSGDLYAQKSKKKSKKSSKSEMKHWQNEVKKYKRNPLALKKLTEGYQEYKKENQELLSKLNNYANSRSKESSKVAQLEQEIDQLSNSLLDAQEKVRDLNSRKTQVTEKSPGMSMAGTVYRVQIGAYERTSIPDNLDTSDEMALENEDGMQKVMVGHFRNLDEAEELKKYLRTMGVKGAWIVPYKDGNRVTMEEATSSVN